MNDNANWINVLRKLGHKITEQYKKNYKTQVINELENFLTKTLALQNDIPYLSNKITVYGDYELLRNYVLEIKTDRNYKDLYCTFFHTNRYVEKRLPSSKTRKVTFLYTILIECFQLFFSVSKRTGFREKNRLARIRSFTRCLRKKIIFII